MPRRGCALCVLAIVQIACVKPPYYARSRSEQLGHLREPGLLLRWKLVRTIPHSTSAYTEGLTLIDGRLFESVGGYGSSRMRELDPESGDVIRDVRDPHEVDGQRFYGEGVSGSASDTLVQLSWKAGRAIVWSKDLAVRKTYKYEGEGWGLCFDGVNYIRSDGSAALHFHAAAGFVEDTQLRRTVRIGGQELRNLNELECVLTDVWANVWQTPFVVRVDQSGDVTGVLDFEPLVKDASASGEESVLNGIAYDAKTRRFFVTGKNWSKIYIVQVDATGAVAPSSVP
jgi:glutaminyl-peptide cyclotransferase